MKVSLSDKNSKYLILLLVIIFSFYRSPYIFFNSRFFAEEASQHFLYAINNSFFDNLIFYDKAAGYYNLTPNILTWFSTLLPLELAPYFTVYGSFLIILFLIYITLFRESDLFDSNRKKILGAILLFISPPLIPEIWINSINSQVYLCLISILILFMKNLSVNQKHGNHFILLISGLSGIYTCVLLPLYFFKFYFHKVKYNFINLIILIFSNIIQLSLVLNSTINNSLHRSVLKIDFSKDMLVNFVYNIISKPFLGRDLTHWTWLKISNMHNNYFIWIALLFILFLLILALNFKKIYNFIKINYTCYYLVIIFFLISSVIIFGSLGNQLGGRYAVIPGVVLILIALDILFKSRNRMLSTFLSIMILISVISGLFEFRPNYKFNSKNPGTNYLKFLDCINCPEWKNEVIQWRKDNKRPIRLWPYPEKQFTLKIANND